jgi:hypothetical protein
MTIDPPDVLLDLDGWADRNDVSTRTVRRWLDAGEIPGARKVKGKWAIPESALRQAPTSAVATVTPPPDTVATARPVTMADALATLPVFVDMDVASRLLGITAHAIKAHPDYFGLVRYGHRGAWVMPKYRIHQLNGTEAQ